MLLSLLFFPSAGGVVVGGAVGVGDVAGGVVADVVGVLFNPARL